MQTGHIQTGQSQQAGTWTGVGLAEPQRLGGVPSAIAAVEVTMSALSQNIAALADRLEKAGVLLPAAVAASGGSQATPPAYATSLANAIDRFRAQSHALACAVTELQGRIDL